MYQLKPKYSTEPPFLVTGYDTVCSVCSTVYEDTDNITTLPKRCKGCAPAAKHKHPLAAAHTQHCLAHYQPITTDWHEWLAAPYQCPNNLHPQYAEYRRETNLQIEFKKWLGFTPPTPPEDPPTEYQLSLSGLSYEQWCDTPEDLQRYLRRDYNMTDKTLTFNQWIKQR